MQRRGRSSAGGDAGTGVRRRSPPRRRAAAAVILHAGRGCGDVHGAGDVAAAGIEAQSLAAGGDALRPRVSTSAEARISEPLEVSSAVDASRRWALARREDSQARSSPWPSATGRAGGRGRRRARRPRRGRMSSQPPEPRRATRGEPVVGRGQRPRPDACAACSSGEELWRRRRMTAAHLRWNESRRDPGQGRGCRARDVPFEVAPRARREDVEVVATVGEANLQLAVCLGGHR